MKRPVSLRAARGLSSSPVTMAILNRLLENAMSIAQPVPPLVVPERTPPVDTNPAKVQAARPNGIVTGGRRTMPKLHGR